MPLTLVESKHFKKFINRLDPPYQLPLFHKKNYDEVRLMVTRKLEGAQATNLTITKSYKSTCGQTN